MALRSRHQWRTSKSKAREITENLKRIQLLARQEVPVIMTADGRDARCVAGTHKFAGIKMAGQRKRADGSWVETYYPVCPICGEVKCDDDGKALMFDGKQCRESLGEVKL